MLASDIGWELLSADRFISRFYFRRRGWSFLHSQFLEVLSNVNGINPEEAYKAWIGKVCAQML